MSRRAKKFLENALNTIAERKIDIPWQFGSGRRDGIFLIKNLWLEFSPMIHIIRHGSKRKKRYKLNNFNISNKLTNKEALLAFDRIKDYLLFFKLVDKTIQGQDIIKCKNITIRTYLINEYGAKKLFEELKAKTVDTDKSSKLLRLNLEGHDHILMVQVKDSTTGEKYLLSVPPNMKNCRQAIAWTFELEAHEYHPLKET